MARAPSVLRRSEHASCSSFYTMEMWNTMKKSEQEVIDKYNLGECCSD